MLKVVVADEHEPRLNAQRLDRSEPVRRRACTGQRGPQRFGVGGRAEDLVPELAGVAGARHPRGNAADADLLRQEPEVAERAHVGVAYAREQIARPRSLQLDVRQLCRDRLDRDV